MDSYIIMLISHETEPLMSSAAVMPTSIPSSKSWQTLGI